MEIITRENFPEKWAQTQNNLAIAYKNRIRGDRADNLKRAIAGYRAALTLRTPTTTPLDCLQTGRNLGNLGFQEGSQQMGDKTGWELALEGYQVAMEAVEQSRAWATSEQRRQEVVRESIGVYENLIQAAINLGNLPLALQTVERSRSKRLADLLAVGDLYADGQIPPDIRQWYQQLQASRQTQAQLHQEHPDLPEDNPAREAYATRSPRASIATQQLQAAEAAERQAWEALYNFDHITAQLQKPQPLPDLAHLTALLPNPHTALLSIYTTTTHTHVLVLRQPTPSPGDLGQWVTCHTCASDSKNDTEDDNTKKDNTKNDLQSWLLDHWVNPYITINQGETKEERQQRRDQWHQAMAPRLQELAQRLQLNTLIHQHLQGITDLILIPHLFLHQIPFDLIPIATPSSSSSPLPQGEGPGVRAYLGDRFRIHYAPSSQILGLCQSRSQQEPSTLGIVENTTSDLLYTPLECEWVAQTWNVQPQHRLQGAAATPHSYRELLTQVQALLSSHHATSRADDPLASHLLLANGQKVTLRDLLSPLWRFPQLLEVFLSCCETGLSFAAYRDKTGDLNREQLDEPLSLGTGFLIAGARSVISSHWAVSDLTTTLFSRQYHQARHGGSDRLTALHQARHALRTTPQQEWLDRLTADQKLAYQTLQQLLNTKDPNTSAAQARYQQIGEIRTWLRENFQPADIPFQNYRDWGAFYCLGLP
ncbi:CHAT domain-containing protein [Prochlorothrix hollandica]|uniref:CHAT domain-containing protein n=1 Tax=Prochlorothrix hollandica PCC 9006 = CALU 1027 TaxID=317619 RepID=A0A0M2Q501_PROHO|nr:CHAT domain-containing protein [Prochlorothrix hollandica]KKJ01667.1 hypothetical protein PROH_02540 [Prochlorothrix hollandica PCC 9006 = CALU 1027]